MTMREARDKCAWAEAWLKVGLDRSGGGEARKFKGRWVGICMICYFLPYPQSVRTHPVPSRHLAVHPRSPRKLDEA